MAKDKRTLDVIPKITSSSEGAEQKIDNISVQSGDKVYKIIISPVNEFTEDDKNVIKAICHKHKNIYMSGYPHSRKTRKKLSAEGRRFVKTDSPKICITYLISDTEDGRLKIENVVSEQEKVLDRFPEEKLTVIIQNWQQDVVDDILATFG